MDERNDNYSKVLQLAEKWYRKIGFPKEYDAGFARLLEEQKNLTCMPFSAYREVLDEEAYGKNLVMYLYFCEELSERYREKGIPEEIMLATVDDFVICTKRNMILRGSLGLTSAVFLADELSMNLFRIGRLQFCMTGAYMDIPAKGIRKGAPVMDVHIPRGARLDRKECDRAFRMAEQFFTIYFPEYHYQWYTCFSWLLDEGLKAFLKEDSNILRFQEMFEVVHKREQDSILHFMFRYGIESREELRECAADTDFAKKIKEYALSGGVFYNVLGVRPHDGIKF